METNKFYINEEGITDVGVWKKAFVYALSLLKNEKSIERIVFYFSKKEKIEVWFDKKENKKFSELCSIMKELPQVLVNAKVPNNKKNIYLEDQEIIDEIVRIEELLKGKGRVLIRPSGTEPLVRVMLEGENQEEIDKLAHGLAKMILNKC